MEKHDRKLGEEEQQNRHEIIPHQNLQQLLLSLVSLLQQLLQHVAERRALLHQNFLHTNTHKWSDVTHTSLSAVGSQCLLVLRFIYSTLQKLKFKYYTKKNWISNSKGHAGLECNVIIKYHRKNAV